MHNIPGEYATEIQSSMRKEVLMLKNFGDGICFFKIEIYFEIQKILNKITFATGKIFFEETLNLKHIVCINDSYIF